MAAVLFVFFAEIATEAFFFAQNLHHHNGKENDKHNARLPAPEPYGSAHEINQRPGQHRIAVNLIRTFDHQVLRTRSHFVAESIHRIPFAATAHIDDCPDAQHEANKHHDRRHDTAPRINRPKCRHPGCKPHNCRNQGDKKNAAQQVTKEIPYTFHDCSPFW